MLLHRGDIVLVPFPFTDLSSKKVRPALIISPDPQQDDIIVAFISSVVPAYISRFDYLLRADHPYFSSTGLKVSSILKTRKILTISHSQILRYLGHLSPMLQSEIDKRILIAVGLESPKH